MESEDYLHAVETMGKILLFTPILLSLITLIFGSFNNRQGLGPEAAFSSGLMMSAGFFTLIYASIMRFKEGLRKGRKKLK
jgi:hypothetical protein